MKRFLLGMMSLGMIIPSAFAEDPVFPTEFDVTANSKDVTIDQYIDEDTEMPTIEVMGTTPLETLTLSFKLPEGWTDMVGYDSSISGMRKAPSYFIPYDTFESGMAGTDLEKGTSFTFAADGQVHISTIFLCAGDQIDVANGVIVLVMVEQGEVPEPEDPEFPEEFNVTADSDNVEIAQYIDEDTEVLTIEVTGTTDKDDVTLTFEIPEGWDGMIGYPMNFGILKKSRAEWPTIGLFREMIGDEDITESNVLTFKADGEPSMGQYFLYVDDLVNVEQGFMVIVNVSKTEGEKDPEFPAELKVAADSSTVTIVQGIDKDTEVLTLTVGGETENDEVVLTFDLPEEWTGVIGGLVETVASRRARSEWPTLETFRETMEGMELTEGKEFSFPVDGEPHIGQYFLYTDDRVDIDHGFAIVVNVKKSESGIDTIETEEGGIRYFNLQGAEINEPEAGIYVKVANGKATKVIVR